MDNEDFEILATEEEEERPVPAPKRINEGIHWEKLPRAKWEDCVGKSYPPEGFCWPEGFCLGCKGEKVSSITGETCELCHGTGRIDPSSRGGEHYNVIIAGRNTYSPDDPRRPKTESKWYARLPYGDICNFAIVEGEGIMRLPKSDHKAVWATSRACNSNGFYTVGVYRPLPPNSDPYNMVKGYTITKVNYLAEQRDLAIRVAERICRDVDCAAAPSKYPKRIELFTSMP
jgi:hypothetical protein